MKNKKIFAILLAGGSGKRFQQDKAVFKLNKKAVFLYSVDTFLKCKKIDEIILVCSKNNIQQIRKILKDKKIDIKTVPGGKETRFESVMKGFEALDWQNEDLILVHNTANPFVNIDDIDNCIKNSKNYDAVAVGHKSVSTVRIAENNQSKIIPREKVWLMETPQLIKADILKKGSEIALKKKIEVTDELVLAELYNVSTKVIEANKKNKKITYPEDVDTFEIEKENFAITNSFHYFQDLIKNSSDSLKIGFGHDSHKFSDSGFCILAGLEFKDAKKLEGNSDGDAAFHALTNAILSTLGKGSLSRFSDQMCKDGITDSQEYLKVALNKLKAQKGEILNCVLSFEAARPKLEKHFNGMQKNLEKILKLKKDQIGLIATSGEGLTSFGRGEGVQVFAHILVRFVKQ